MDRVIEYVRWAYRQERRFYTTSQIMELYGNLATSQHVRDLIADAQSFAEELHLSDSARRELSWHIQLVLTELRLCALSL